MIVCVYCNKSTGLIDSICGLNAIVVKDDR
jgi:hypothetical protein